VGGGGKGKKKGKQVLTKRGKNVGGGKGPIGETKFPTKTLEPNWLSNGGGIRGQDKQGENTKGGELREGKFQEKPYTEFITQKRTDKVFLSQKKKKRNAPKKKTGGPEGRACGCNGVKKKSGTAKKPLGKTWDMGERRRTMQGDQKGKLRWRQKKNVRNSKTENMTKKLPVWGGGGGGGLEGGFCGGFKGKTFPDII